MKITNFSYTLRSCDEIQYALQVDQDADSRTNPFEEKGNDGIQDASHVDQVCQNPLHVSDGPITRLQDEGPALVKVLQIIENPSPSLKT